MSEVEYKWVVLFKRKVAHRIRQMTDEPWRMSEGTLCNLGGLVKTDTRYEKKPRKYRECGRCAAVWVSSGRKEG